MVSKPRLYACLKAFPFGTVGTTDFKFDNRVGLKLLRSLASSYSAL